MARITIEDCLKRVPNRFAIVNLAAKRVRQIREGSEYLVSSPKNEDIVVALREIAAGKVTFEEKASAELESKPETNEEAQLEAPPTEEAAEEVEPDTEEAESTADEAPAKTD